MSRLSTNLDVRAYAALHDVRLGDIAKALGMSGPDFSVGYMRRELTQTEKKMLRHVIDGIVRDREDDDRRI